MASSSYKKLFGFKDESAQLDGDHTASGSEDEDADQAKVAGQTKASHAKLMESISSLDKKKRTNLKQRSEASVEVSEFNFSGQTGESGDVKVHELVGSLANTASHSKLKKQLSSVQRNEHVLPAPLHKHEADKVRRTVAYNAVSKEVDKWDEVVQKNRRLEHMSFPLNQPVIGIQSTDQFVKQFKPSTPLEQEVYKLLNGSKHRERPDKELTIAEEEALQSMSLEEARERRAELQKTRALLSYYEAKCRRQKKIKSKSYHRIQRKSRNKEEAEKLKEKIQASPDDAEEILQNIEKARAKERVTLKHRNTGKWAKGIVRFGKYDKTARTLIADQLEKSRELTKKIAQVNEEEEEDGGDAQGQTPEEERGKPKLSLTDINNPWFAGSLAGKKEATEEVGAEPKVAALEPVVGQLPQDSSDSEDDSANEDAIDKLFEEEEREDSKRMGERRDGGPDLAEEAPLIDEVSVQDEAGPSEEASDAPGTTTHPSESAGREQETITVDLSKVLPTSPAEVRSVAPELVVSEDPADSRRRAHLLNIQEAFAEDDVVRVFAEDKREKVDRDRPKDVDLTLPGWGAWGGVGVRPSKRKKSRFIIKAPPAPRRRDENLQHVLINESRDKKIAMHQVNELPFPFANSEHFQRSIRAPIGGNWNTPSTVKKLTVPKVTTKLGSIIEPITAAETFKTSRKRKAKQISERRGSGGGKPDLSLDTGKEFAKKKTHKKRRK